MKGFTLKLNKPFLRIISLLGLIIAINFIVILNTLAEKQASIASQSYQRAVIDTVALATERVLLPIDRLLQNMTSVASQLPRNLQSYNQVIPHLLANNESARFISGAAIWPKPMAFSSSNDRQNYYWRNVPNAGGAVQFERNTSPFSKDYTDSDWHKTANKLKMGQKYWSNQYQKTSTGLKIITVAAPYFDSNRRLKGVISIDVLLMGLNQMFVNYAQRFGGYLIAVGQTDNMVIHPANVIPELVTIMRPYQNIKTLAQKHSAYTDTVNTMDAARQQLQLMPVTSEKRLNTIIPISSATNNPSIQPQNYASDIAQIEISNDIIIGKAAYATLFYLPRIDWFVISVASQERVTAGTEKSIGILALASLLALLVTLGLGYLLLIREDDNRSSEVNSG